MKPFPDGVVISRPDTKGKFYLFYFYVLRVEIYSKGRYYKTLNSCNLPLSIRLSLLSRFHPSLIFASKTLALRVVFPKFHYPGRLQPYTQILS
jgi:hypothetical protein